MGKTGNGTFVGPSAVLAGPRAPSHRWAGVRFRNFRFLGGGRRPGSGGLRSRTNPPISPGLGGGAAPRNLDPGATTRVFPAGFGSRLKRRGAQRRPSWGVTHSSPSGGLFLPVGGGGKSRGNGFSFRALRRGEKSKAKGRPSPARWLGRSGDVDFRRGFRGGVTKKTGSPRFSCADAEGRFSPTVERALQNDGRSPGAEGARQLHPPTTWRCGHRRGPILRWAPARRDTSGDGTSSLGEFGRFSGGRGGIPFGATCSKKDPAGRRVTAGEW